MRGVAVSRPSIHELVSCNCRLAERLLRDAAALAIIALLMFARLGQVAADDAAKYIGGDSAAYSAPGIETYIVQPHDTLYSIGKRYNISPRVLRALNGLTDADLLAQGQALLVPKLNDNLVLSYEVKTDDTLYRIARRFGSSAAELRSLNGIGSDNRIMLGQTLLLPKRVNSTQREDFAFGIAAFAAQESAAAIGHQTARLGVNWVKLEVSWAAIEPVEGQFEFAALDATIEELDKIGIRILLNIHDAPGWTRRSYQARLSRTLRMNTGPPEDPDEFGDFMSVLAHRYAGVVDAYEIWKAPNILKYWNAPVFDQPPRALPGGDFALPDRIDIGAAQYLEYLRAAFDAIKSADSAALVITGGLAPVGFTDHYNSIETGTFLQNMLLAGATEYSDGIGAIFGASAVPPRLFCCQQPAGIDSHYESYFQYFREILYLYDHILTRNGASHMPIYVTQVGWGTTDGANLAIPAEGLEWLQYTDEAEQAAYVTHAYELATSLTYIKGMFLYNLNGCAVGDQEGCFFSLFDANGVERPAFEAFRLLRKQAARA